MRRRPDGKGHGRNNDIALYNQAIRSLVEFIITHHGRHVAGVQYRIACQDGALNPDAVEIVFSQNIFDVDDEAIANALKERP